ncbi:MAG TPA: hypothetical protein VFV49_14285 [Thermoanaerobaculia bacterium]|nr:hypothetical protein [Thermoanaerobaculia bacterium]
MPTSNPDLDGVACAIGYAELLDARAWLPGQMDAEAQYVYDVCNAPLLATGEDVAACHRFVLVDGSSLAGFPETIAPRDVVEVIDHRAHHRASIDFPRAAVDIEPVGAAATLIAERFRCASRTPSPQSIVLLYAAVMSNTQSLLGSVTTSRDREAAQELLDTGHIPPGLVAGQFAARRAAIVADLRTALLREHKHFEDPQGPYVVTQLELTDTSDLLHDHESQLRETLGELGERTMLNVVNPSSGSSVLFIADEAFRAEVSLRLGIQFDGTSASFDRAVLRKQIVAKLAGASWSGR